MHMSFQWIKDYLADYKGSPEEMQQALTFSGTEVEGLLPKGDDVVLDVGVTSNRVDCLGHIGLAREVAATSGARLVLPLARLPALSGAPGGGVTVEVEQPARCPRYTAQILEGVAVGPAPAWLAARLQAVSLASVNNVVDITNFVLLEWNQPLHAFDLDRLEGGTLMVRQARRGEEIEAINGKTYLLDEEDLVIADGRGPVAIAGVMGGKRTEVREGTQRILIESALFDAVSVRRTSRRLKLFSDSSFRFERGLDRRGVLEASKRASSLMVELCGGKFLGPPLDAGGPGGGPSEINLRLSRSRKVLGISISVPEAASILERLGCTVAPGAAEELLVRPPSWRGDLCREIDLIEELIRLHGLDKLTERTHLPLRTVTRNPARLFRERIRDRMALLGLMEVLTPNFVPEDACEEVAFLHGGEGLKARQPVRANEGALRRSLLPSLLAVAKRNRDLGNRDLRIFELSNLYFREDPPAKLPRHIPSLAFLLEGDLRDARGVLEALFFHLGAKARFEPSARPHLEADAQGEVFVGGEVLGVLGRPARSLCKSCGLKESPVFGELNLEQLFLKVPQAAVRPSLPRFPGVVRDLSLVVAEKVSFAKLEEAALRLDLKHLESVSLSGEVYRSKDIGAARKNLVLRLLFRSPGRTLTAGEVEQEMARLIQALARSAKAVVRGP